MPDWSRVRGPTKNGPWSSKLGVWHGANTPPCKHSADDGNRKLSYPVPQTGNATDDDYDDVSRGNAYRNVAVYFYKNGSIFFKIQSTK